MKTRIFSLIILGIMLLTVRVSYSQNLLTDGDFSTTTVIEPSYGWPPPNVWSYWQEYGIDANPTVEDGVCSYYVNSSGYSGYNTWEIQLVQAGFTLEQGHAYRLSFDVRADADRTFGLFLGQNEGDWVNYLGDRYIQNATTEWQTIILDFNATCAFAYHKLSFEIGTINTSMYFDNVILTDLGPYQPSVGILGNSIGGWYVDVDMVTSDDIHYNLSDFPLASGMVKFRQDNMWCINWGAPTFPTGTGYLNGPDIPVTNAGNYDIAFNRETGEYSFACVSNCSPYIGILGTAVPPDYSWDNDINMQTSDGITYKLNGISFIDGEAKFRQNDSWTVNWSDDTFPSGTGTQDGPGIPLVAGNYNVTFNAITGEYSFSSPEIGILGSALNGWTDDIDMQTDDGIIFTLTDYTFTDGEVKFRQDNDWAINWGDYAFPAGYAYGNGPNIPVPAGNYTVTFNRMTGEYLFMATTCPFPGIVCPNSIYDVTSPGVCGAYIYYPVAVAAPNCGGEEITITQTEGLPSGSFFPTGVTTNSFVLTNASGATAMCSFDVVIYDAEPPVIENLSVDPASLWPPNHMMVPVTVNYTVWDNCGGAVNSQLWVWSNEPDNGIADGNTALDYQVLDENHVLLRAERAGRGIGREYYIIVFCWDDSWNYNMQQIIVTVPLAQDSGVPKLIVKSGGTDTESGTLPVKVMIWPNPGDKYFNLEVQSSSDESIELYIHDTNGQLISVVNVTDKNSYRFGDDLHPGIYLATVRQGAYFNTLKIVKK